ncbi:MAG: tetratricopeptide repeat protein, partial [Gammaproteobacteria bacterium]
LGNHYAAQGRWSEAQGAYYNALLTARRSAGGPVHPDYAFNLAVSLEQLNQPQAGVAGVVPCNHRGACSTR